MRVTKVLSTSITAAALALSMLASTIPAAAIAGNHAAYFSESSFLGLANGQSGQFAVGYSNTGDTAWTKGSASSQASLRTRSGSTTLSDAGWANGWVSPSIYANQANDLVAPGQVGFFIYNIQVPSSAPLGPTTFSGVEWIANAPAEDFGYFQIVTVTGSAITITGSTPASPSTNTTPVISGTGATATTIVTVAEGATTLCTATASATGTFTCTVSALSAGSHSITATAAGQGTSAVFTYVVDTGAPTIVSVDTAGGVQRLNVCYNKAMTTSGGGDIRTLARYTLSPTVTLTGTTGVQDSTISADGKCVVFTFGSTGGLTKDVQYTLSVSGVTDAAGNPIAAASTFAFTATDSTNITATGITQPGNQEIVVQFSEQVATGTITAANFKWDSAAFQNTPTVRSSTNQTNKQVRLTLSTTAASVGTHTLDVTNVTDAAGNMISPNPTSFTVTIATDTTRPTVTSAVPSRNDIANVGGAYFQGLTINYSEGMKAIAGGWSAGTSVIDTTSNYTLSNPDGSSATTGCSSGAGTAITVSSASMSHASTGRFLLTAVRLQLSTFFGSGCQYTVSVNNVQDQAGNAVSPNPTLVSFTDTADTATFSATSASIGPNTAGTASQLLVCYNKTVNWSTSATTAGNYTSTGTNSFTISGAGTNGASTPAASADQKCVLFPLSTLLPSGSYQVTITGVLDPAGNTISPNPTVINIGFSDTNAPRLLSAQIVTTGASFSVTYSKAMSGGATPSNSAGNIANYSYNNQTYGNVCATGTAAVTSNSAGTVWTVTCTTLPAPTGPAVVISVRNVADTNGNVISPNPSSASYPY